MSASPLCFATNAFGRDGLGKADDVRLEEPTKYPESSAILEPKASELDSASTSSIAAQQDNTVKRDRSPFQGLRRRLRNRFLSNKEKNLTPTLETKQKPGGLDPEVNLSGQSSQTLDPGSPAMIEMAEYRKQDAFRIQKSTPFHRRVRWSKSDRETLQKTIKELRRGNEDLESLLVVKPVNEPSLLLVHEKETKSLLSTTQDMRAALTRLHKALTPLNIRTKDGGPYDLSVQLHEDPNVNADEIGRQSNLRVNVDRSFVYNIQRRELNNPNGEAELLFAYTHKKNYKVSLDLLGVDVKELHNLHVAPSAGPAAEAEDDNTIELWGTFDTPATAERDTHVLYRDTGGKWLSPLTLANLISDPAYEYRKRMNPTRICQLARLLLTSHIFFSAVFDEVGTNPRPENYAFFCGVDEPLEVWDAEVPMVEKPWLSFGFGSKPKRKRLGTSSGIAKPPNVPMVELGLVLYQICSGDELNYSGQNGYAQAKTRAMEGCNVVDNMGGWPLVSIIQGCLSPDTLTTDGSKLEVGPLALGSEGTYSTDEREYLRERPDIDFILRAITTLWKYEQKLESTMTIFEGQDIVANRPLQAADSAGLSQISTPIEV